MGAREFKLTKTQIRENVCGHIAQHCTTIGILPTNKSGFFEILATPQNAAETHATLQSILSEMTADKHDKRFRCTVVMDGKAVRLKILHKNKEKLEEIKKHVRKALTEHSV